MKRKLMIAVVTIVGTTALAILTIALVGRPESAAAPGAAQKVAEGSVATLLAPDTSSPNWKQLSDDVGVMIRKDDQLGLRGRLYVRIRGTWTPMATDGVADSLGTVPVR